MQSLLDLGSDLVWEDFPADVPQKFPIDIPRVDYFIQVEPLVAVYIAKDLNPPNGDNRVHNELSPFLRGMVPYFMVDTPAADTVAREREDGRAHRVDELLGYNVVPEF